jgi:hypothetical protein
MPTICNVIIPRDDPKVVESIGNIGIGYFNAKLELAQNTQQLEELKQELAKFILDTPSHWSIKTKVEAAIKELEAFNEKVKVMLKTTAVVFKKSIVNVYKKIVSCNRAVRSHNRVSNFFKSSSGDSGDPDQPEPPRPTHLTPPIQQNRFILSWQTAPGYCSMFGGGQA